MTQEQKDLLLKDLSARLPYSVKVHFLGWDSEYLQQKEMVDTLYSIDSDGYCNTDEYDSLLELGNIKPYLFPLSSMTEEQKSQYSFFLTRIIDGYDSSLLIDWLHKNHFNYRGLIEKGLAIDATDKNIY